MTQSHLIVKEEGIHYFLMPEEPNVPRDLALLDYQMHNIRSDYDRWQEYDKDVQQAQSSAILCEDQERATELIIKLHYPDLVPVADRLDLEIGSIYPVPGIEFEPVEKKCDALVCEINSKCCYRKMRDKSTGEPLTGCLTKTVARLIEHTAEKAPSEFRAARKFERMIGYQWLQAESPEIDKEDESQEDIWRDLFRKYDSSTWYNASNEFTINRKP